MHLHNEARVARRAEGLGVNKAQHTTETTQQHKVNAMPTGEPWAGAVWGGEGGGSRDKPALSKAFRGGRRVWGILSFYLIRKQ